MKKPTKAQPGRPAFEEPTRTVNVRLTSPQIAALDEIRLERTRAGESVTRSELVREIIDAALKSRK